MPAFSITSKKRLAGCHEILQFLFNTVILIADCSIICGQRGEQAQNKAFATGASKKKFPDSLHNKTPSLAVDVMPYPIDYNDTERIEKFAEIVKQVIKENDLPVVWGGDLWSKINPKTGKREGFVDLPHWQIDLKKIKV